MKKTGVDIDHRHSTEQTQKKEGRATQKPEILLERIILASTNESDRILDPFSGSGTTGVAAIRHKRSYVGIELDKTYLDLTNQRLIDECKILENRLL